jgi:hypothetical protein
MAIRPSQKERFFGYNVYTKESVQKLTKADIPSNYGSLQGAAADIRENYIRALEIFSHVYIITVLILGLIHNIIAGFAILFIGSWIIDRLIIEPFNLCAINQANLLVLIAAIRPKYNLPDKDRDKWVFRILYELKDPNYWTILKRYNKKMDKWRAADRPCGLYQPTKEDLDKIYQKFDHEKDIMPIKIPKKIPFYGNSNKEIATYTWDELIEPVPEKVLKYEAL